jgi:hypothetical protein
VSEPRTVHVTAADLASGQPLKCARCPVTLAVKRAFPDARDVVTGADTVYMTRAGWREEHALAAHVRVNITAIDARKPVAPFLFIIGEPKFSYVAQERRRAA